MLPEETEDKGAGRLMEKTNSFERGVGVSATVQE